MDTAENYLKNLDWDAAIAAASHKIDAGEDEDEYLNLGIAYCCKDSKDGTYTKAIKNLSGAIATGTEDAKDEDFKASYYRAYAYYREGNYERAVADCNNKLNELSELETNKSKTNELLGIIYSAMNDYPKAVHCFDEVMKHYIGKKELIPSSLLNNYLEACKGMKRQ